MMFVAYLAACYAVGFVLALQLLRGGPKRPQLLSGRGQDPPRPATLRRPRSAAISMPAQQPGDAVALPARASLTPPTTPTEPAVAADPIETEVDYPRLAA